MRSLYIFGLVGLLLLEACKKNDSVSYAGNYYIRIPLVENNNTYFDPGGFDGLYIRYNAQAKRQWKFIHLNGQEYNIAAADSTSILITDFGTETSLAPKNSVNPNTQIFNIIPDLNSKAVYFQSVASGKFVQLDFCFKAGETWGYDTPMNDSSACPVYQIINLSDQADTCYCVNRYILENN
jgi:hypothetical protein